MGNYLTWHFAALQLGDGGAGSEESSSAAAEETPVGEVQPSSADASGAGEWQLGAPSVGDAPEAPGQSGADGAAGAATDEGADADSGAGAEESASQVPCAVITPLA